MIFTTDECAWSQISMKLLGRTIVGLRGFEIKKGIEKELLYAAGPDPIDIQSGNKKPEGSVKLLKYEVDQMNDAAQLAGFDDILEVPHTLISLTCAFKKTKLSQMRVIEIAALAFTDLSYSMEQNAKMMDVTLPFLAMLIRSFKSV